MRILLNICLVMLIGLASVEARIKIREEEESGFFSGRVSRVNTEAGLIRIKLDFNNQKYLNKKDRVEFWDEHDPTKRCKAYIIGKTANYILLRIPEVKYCERFVFMANGAYVKFYSQDLANNLKMGRQLMDILLKKHMALKGKLENTKRQLDNHLEKISAVNNRYKILRDKLELEWRNEISNLEEDQSASMQVYRDVEKMMNEVNFKLEQYRIEDENLKTDRWALDPRQYYKK